MKCDGIKKIGYDDAALKSESKYQTKALPFFNFFDFYLMTSFLEKVFKLLIWEEIS